MGLNTTHRRFVRGSLAIIFCIVTPLASMAGTIKDHEAALADEDSYARPFEIKSRAQFACAEVAMSQTGGTTTHEINLTPRNVERCELVKVGTRLHECKKYRFKKSTVDDRGVVSIATEDGPVQFWFDEETRISGKKNATQIKEGAGKGTLTFTWPDKNKKYLCAAMH